MHKKTIIIIIIKNNLNSKYFSEKGFTQKILRKKPGGLNAHLEPTPAFFSCFTR